METYSSCNWLIYVNHKNEEIKIYLDYSDYLECFCFGYGLGLIR